MRNPKHAISRLPLSREVGKAVHKLLWDASNIGEVKQQCSDLFGGKPITEFDPALILKLRELVLRILNPHGSTPPPKTVKAQTPISADVLWS